MAFLWDIWSGLIMWTHVTELITLIWFFPLVFMDVTGIIYLYICFVRCIAFVVVDVFKDMK